MGGLAGAINFAGAISVPGLNLTAMSMRCYSSRPGVRTFHISGRSDRSDSSFYDLDLSGPTVPELYDVHDLDHVHGVGVICLTQLLCSCLPPAHMLADWDL